MKSAYTMLFILVALFLVLSGCSEEKPDNYENKNVVRKVIQKPVMSAGAPEDTGKEIIDISKQNTDNITAEEVTEQPVPVVPVQEEKTYVTEEGDTLSGISAKTDIYNNPLKWPLLYRDNPEAFSFINDKANLSDTGLPAGIRLKIMSEEEMKKNLENRAGSHYVANIISSPNIKEIASQVVRLIDAGYFVYISSAMVDDREWYRLRTEFYKTRSEANKVGEEIRTHLNIPDIWTVKIGDEEFHEFGGY
ncbi:MAG: hypothetical protein JXL81_00030 [Deltaproteobacteria bacterium]|nr:hypothetical protein [Deltaproteobacteria bacterium]